MIALIRKLLGLPPLCAHKWITDDAKHMCFVDERHVTGRVFYQHCEKCGDVRRKELS